MLDGTLIGAPEVVSPRDTAPLLGNSNSTVRAVQACQPFELRAVRYEVWKELVPTLDARDTF